MFLLTIINLFIVIKLLLFNLVILKIINIYIII